MYITICLRNQNCTVVYGVIVFLRGFYGIYKFLDFLSLYKDNSRMLTANIWQFSIIYILTSPRSTITLYTSVQCWIRKYTVMYTTDHFINLLIGRSVVYIWGKLYLYVFFLYGRLQLLLQCSEKQNTIFLVKREPCWKL